MTSLAEASAIEWTDAYSKEGTSYWPGGGLAAAVSAAYQQTASWLTKRSCASALPWVQMLTDENGYRKVLDKATLLAKNGMFPDDNLFKKMAGNGMLQDHVVLFRAADPSAEAACEKPQQHSCEVLALYQLGYGVCGHAGIVHGGITATLMDETFGYLLYLARSEGFLDFQAVLTASLEVQYKAPLVPTAPVVVRATITQVVGRKVWVSATVTDQPLDAPVGSQSSTDSPASSSSSLSTASAAAPKVYATGKALFIIPRPDSATTAALQQAGKSSTTVLGGLKRPRHTRDHGNPSDV